MQQTSQVPLLEKLAVRAQVTTEIEAYLSSKKKAAALISPQYEALWESIATLASAGGKRLRGYMVYLAYITAHPGNKSETWIHAAAAVELLHLALLIHDDIIDRDLIRYGVQNVSGQQLTHYEPLLNDNSEARHFADSAAILAGDLLIGGAFELLNAVTCSTEARAAMQTYMHEALFRVAGGELLDTETAFVTPSPSALQIAEEKTASYSFSSPLLIGASLGGADKQAQATLRKFGTALGIAYQLQDDLLGMFGDESITGKSTDGDLREGKRTYLVEQFFTRANNAEKEAFTRAFGTQHASYDEQLAAKQALIDSGARQAVENKIAALVGEAEAAVEALNYSEEASAAYYALIELCVKRDK